MVAPPPTGAPTPPARRARIARIAAEQHEELMAYIGGRRRVFTDWVLVALCWLALVPNAWLLWFRPATGSWRDAVLYADLALAALLFASVCWRWLRFRIGRHYLRRHWWEIPALLPLAWVDPAQWHWALWAVLLARVVRVVDRTDNIVGDRITAALVTHFSDPIVEAIKKPITVAVLDEVIDVIKTGDYAANVRAALEENRADIEAMVLELVKRDQTAGRLRFVPFHDDIVRTTTDTVLRILDGALDDPRTTELISDVIRNSATQLRHAVRERA